MTLIYGVDASKTYTAYDVKNALIQCFIEAHRDAQAKELEQITEGMDETSSDKLTRANIEITVKNAFRETGGNIDKPTKETIIKAMNYLKDFSKQYRGMDVITEHYNEIMQLVNGLKE